MPHQPHRHAMRLAENDRHRSPPGSPSTGFQPLSNVNSSSPPLRGPMRTGGHRRGCRMPERVVVQPPGGVVEPDGVVEFGRRSPRSDRPTRWTTGGPSGGSSVCRRRSPRPDRAMVRASGHRPPRRCRGAWRSRLASCRAHRSRQPRRTGRWPPLPLQSALVSHWPSFPLTAATCESSVSHMRPSDDGVRQAPVPQRSGSPRSIARAAVIRRRSSTSQWVMSPASMVIARASRRCMRAERRIGPRTPPRR